MCSKGIRCRLLSEVCVLARVYPDDRCVHMFVFAHLSGFMHLGERKLNVSVCTHVCGYRLPALLLRVCVCACLDSTRPHAPIVSNRWADKMPEKQQLPPINHCQLFTQQRVARLEHVLKKLSS